MIGIDASIDAMLDASSRAARSPKRGGLPNALFVVAAAESLPHELNAIAGCLTVHFPWGSLLRGLLTAEPSIVAGMARLLRPGAALAILHSVTEHDRIAGIGALDEQVFAALAPCYAAHGLTLVEARSAHAEVIAASHSTWAKRLGAGAARPVWLARFQRCPVPGNA